MKTIIAGGRDVTDSAAIEEAVRFAPFHITEVVSGVCRGADVLGEQWAARNDIPVKQFPADWRRHGLAAGPIRNAEMAAYADALIAVGGGHGTADMVAKMDALGKPVVWRR